MTHRRALPSDRIALVAALVWAGISSLAPSARADDWGKLAAISSTMGVQANRLCIGEATRGDLGCPATAPSLTTAGDVSVTGNLSAQKFVGDGSGLTGLNAANVSVTTGASGSLVYRDAYGSLTASSTLSISSTTGSVGIGAGPSAGLGSYGLYAAGRVETGTSMYVTSGPFLGVSGGMPLVRSNTGTDLAFSGGYNLPEAMRIVSTGYIGIGTANPSSTLHIIGSSGGISGGLIIGAATGSAMRAAVFPVGNNSTAMQIFNNTGGFYIKNKSGNNFALFDNDAGALMIGSGVNGNPSATLFVRGSTLTTSWTGINFSNALNVTPTAPLEVSGTISATRFVGNGSGLTGIAANDNIVSGSAYVKAVQDTGAMVSGTLQLAGSTAPGTGCASAADHGKLKWENGMLLVCK